MKRDRNIEDLLLRADFSAETDLKDRLRRRLFGTAAGAAAAGKAGSFAGKNTLAYRRLDENDLSMVSAAGELVAKIEEQEKADRPTVMPVIKEEI